VKWTLHGVQLFSSCSEFKNASIKMLLFLFVLFFSVATAQPLQSAISQTHPDLDSLNRLSTQLGDIASQIRLYDGNSSSALKILRSTKIGLARLEQSAPLLNWDASLRVDRPVEILTAGLHLAYQVRAVCTSLVDKKLNVEGADSSTRSNDLPDELYKAAMSLLEAIQSTLPDYFWIIVAAI
jgi:hypothetical protein